MGGRVGISDSTLAAARETPLRLPDFLPASIATASLAPAHACLPPKPDTLPKSTSLWRAAARRHCDSEIPSTMSVSKRSSFDREARALRSLLLFYFEPFNLQHNRLLMSLVEEQCSFARSGAASNRESPLAELGFGIDDVSALPRVGRLFERHRSNEAKLRLLTAALPEELELSPVRLHVGSPGGEPRLQLAYQPMLRRIFEAAPLRKAGPLACMLPPHMPQRHPELRALLGFESGPHAWHEPPPSNVSLVISYSVSSDLSHSQSPKAADARNAIYEGAVDPSVMIWESRLQRMKRQLLYYAADIVCLQSLQSIGFAVRCSEQEHDWFSCDDEPLANHLVHLYRELNKSNYGVVFAPTLKLPGCDTICLGNAIFWKRWRWRLEGHYGLNGSAVCAELFSRVGGSRVIACSAKTAASYALEWGDSMTSEELLCPARSLLACLTQDAQAAGARLIMCCDLGCDPPMLRAGIPQLAEGPALVPPPSEVDIQKSVDLTRATQSATQCSNLASAYRSLLGKEPWTSASKHTQGRAVDYIFHDKRLMPLAVLGGLPGEVDAIELLRTGYPSDHLLLLAGFMDTEGSCIPQLISLSSSITPSESNPPPSTTAHAARSSAYGSSEERPQRSSDGKGRTSGRRKGLSRCREGLGNPGGASSGIGGHQGHHHGRIRASTNSHSSPSSAVGHGVSLVPSACSPLASTPMPPPVGPLQPPPGFSIAHSAPVKPVQPTEGHMAKRVRGRAGRRRQRR